MKKNEIREMFLIISSFIVGSLVTLLFLKIINIGNSNNYIIDKKNTKIYEKASLASSIEKIYQAVVLIETYNDNELKSNGTGFIYKVDDKGASFIANRIELLKED